MIINGNKIRIFNHDIGFYVRYKSVMCDFIPIPKNSSTYVESFFDIALGEKSYENFKFQTPITPKKTIVVLRDPIDRWISGIVHYFYLTNQVGYEVIPKTIWDFVTNQIVFDEHTELQSRFLPNLDTDDIFFFKQDQTLQANIEEFIKVQFNIPETAWIKKKNKIQYNKSLNFFYKNKLKKYVLGLSFNNKVLLNRLKKVYEPDFELFNSVNFYGKSNVKGISNNSIL